MGKIRLSGYVNGNDFLHKFNEEDKAAMILLHIKHANCWMRNLPQLCMKSKTKELGISNMQQILASQNPFNVSKENHGLLTLSMKAYSCKPPDFPPFPRLNSLIGACSKPFEKQLAFSYVRGDQSKLSLNKLDVKNSLTIAKQERRC